MDICPANFICFDKHTFLLLIVGAIIIVTHYIGNTNDKLELIKYELNNSKIKFNKKLNKLNEHTNQYNNIPVTLPVPDPSTVYRNRVDDPLSAPVRSSPYTIPSVPINIPTQGEPSGYQQVGILIEENGSGNNQVKLPLFGQQIYPRSREWNYYTNSDGYQSIKLGLNYNGRNSMDRYGAEELYDNNIVEVDGYDSKFKVTIYRLDAPRYIPNKI